MRWRNDKEIEKLKGEFESTINGMNMVGKIPYNVYSELYDEGTKQIQRAYELGKAELEKENAELKADNDARRFAMAMSEKVEKQLREENAELKEKFLKVKADDVRKSKLDSFKTLEEKNEYLRQVANYAIFNEDISVMFWCFVQRGDIYTDQLTKAKEIIRTFLNMPMPNNEEVFADVGVFLTEAEQFIKDSEVEK